LFSSSAFDCDGVTFGYFYDWLSVLPVSQEVFLCFIYVFLEGEFFGCLQVNGLCGFFVEFLYDEDFEEVGSYAEDFSYGFVESVDVLGDLVFVDFEGFLQVEVYGVF